ncbi:MAG: hypothetical protein QOI47_1857 [Actinomycetota bacterium]|nr:hypothetical protein [Actinomycetota bacterium]
MLVLAVQDGVGPQALADALGVSRGSMASTLQSVRRKLAVPPHQELRRFVEGLPNLAALLTSGDADKVIDLNADRSRRRRDLLRLTIDELKAAAVRARRRGEALQCLPLPDGEDAAVRVEEAELVLGIAELLDAAVATVVAKARGGVEPD